MSKKIFAYSTIPLLLIIPVIALAVDFGTPPTVYTSPTDPALVDFIPKILGLTLDLIWILFIAFAVIMFIVAGFQFLAAHGDPEGVGKARKALLWGIIGVVVALLAFIIPFFIRNTISPPRQAVAPIAPTLGAPPVAP